MSGMPAIKTALTPQRRTDAWLWVGGVVSVVIVIGAGVAGWWWSGARRTEVAQWIMASASVATLVAAVAAAVFTARALLLESQREWERRDLEIQAQASLVAAWPVDTPGYGIVEPDGLQYLRQVDVEFRNASQLPVTNVRVTVGIQADDTSGAKPIEFGASPQQPVLRPGGKVSFLKVMGGRPITSAEFKGLSSGNPMNRVVTELRFTDAAGRKWLRTSPPGTLVRE